MVERFWDIIEDININKVLLFLRDNIVGTVILVTALIWIPASCLVSYFDRRRLHKEEKHREWSETDAFMHPTDMKRTIIQSKVTRKNRVTPQY